MNNMSPVAYGLITAIIGMLVVFAMLALLIVFVWFMGKLISGMVNSRDAKAAAKAAAKAEAAPAPAPAPVVEAAPAVEESTVVDDAQLIAVIAAAIAAFDNSGKSLVVRKVRRVNGWNNAARREQVYKF